MPALIDFKSAAVSQVLNLLLKDRTTGKNIIFATSAYDGVDFLTPLTAEIIFSGRVDIRPRVLKSLAEQVQRTRQKAEVFTPAWLCNQMNNYCDTEWFGRENVFNVEKGEDWQPTTEKIEFPTGKSWQDYIFSRRLEITCGEAPYIVARYDMVTGDVIPVYKRMGILDRKLRIINENVNTHKAWNKWVYRAFESVYGYEFQGDNLLIARINLLETFCEYTREKWQKEPSAAALARIADIISWNLWQMDGIHGVVPGYTAEPCQLSLFDEVAIEPADNRIETIDCKIYDWQAGKSIAYNSVNEG